MEFNAPDVVLQIKEVKAIYDMNEVINPISDAEMLDRDLFTGTATEHGIERRERLYGIFPKDTDTLEDRRFRVRTKENDKIPYTIGTLRQRLETLCGKDGYKIEVTKDTVSVKVDLTRKTMYEDAKGLLEKMVPLNMLLNVSLLYNQYKTFSKYTHEELSKYTYEQLREEVLNK